MHKHTFYNVLTSIHGSIGQCVGPLFWLVNKVESINPHTIIEIGTGEG